MCIYICIYVYIYESCSQGLYEIHYSEMFSPPSFPSCQVTPPPLSCDYSTIFVSYFNDDSELSITTSST